MRQWLFPEELQSFVLKHGGEVSFPFCKLQKSSWIRNKWENWVCKGGNVNGALAMFKPGGKL